MKKITQPQNNIQALLDKQGMSSRTLAKKVHGSHPQVGRVINGTTPLTIKWIFNIAEALNVDALDVITHNLSKAVLKKYDSVLLGSIMGYLIEEANDHQVQLNVDTLSKLTTYICEEAVDRQLNDFLVRRLAMDAIQFKKICSV